MKRGAAISPIAHLPRKAGRRLRSPILFFPYLIPVLLTRLWLSRRPRISTCDKLRQCCQLRVRQITVHSVLPSRPPPRTRTTPTAAPRPLHAHKRLSAVGQSRIEQYKRHRSHLTITTESLCRPFYVGVAEGGRPVEARDCLRSLLIPR